MARSLHLHLLALAPIVASCSTQGAAPFVLAQAEAIPPVPAELLAATNGKADAPVQLEMAMVMAAQRRRETLILEGMPEPLRTAQVRAPSPPSKPAPVGDPALLLGLVDAGAQDHSVLPGAPLRYAQLMAMDAAAHGAPAAAYARPVATAMAQVVRRRVPIPTANLKLAAATHASRQPEAAMQISRASSIRSTLRANPNRGRAAVERTPVLLDRIKVMIFGLMTALRV